MPPNKKASAFEQLMHKTKGSGVKKAVPGSAFELIRRKNEYRRTGVKRSYNHNYDQDDESTQVSRHKNTPRSLTREHTGNLASAVINHGGGTAGLQRPMKIGNPRTARADTTESAPERKSEVVEMWRPAGGEQITESSERDHSLTTSLGLARLATWRIKSFVAEAEKLMKETGADIPELKVKEMIHGGESVSDVFAKFEDAVEADMMRDQIQGALILGRKLQVRFA